MASKKVTDFIDEIIAVCRKHGLSISHEDGHGSFVIEPLDEHNVEWLRRADASAVMSDDEAAEG